MFFRDTPERNERNDRGDNLIGLVVAMVVIALLVPGLLVLMMRSQQLASTTPDRDEGIQARAEIAEMLGSVDPIGLCASPTGGPDAAYRDKCFREKLLAGKSLAGGASLIAAPDLPAASPDGYAACWLIAQENGPRQRRCIILEGDQDEVECVDSPSGPCLKVPSESDEAAGELVLVDKHGGGRLLIRSWDELDSDGDPATEPFLPHEWADEATDRLIYTDVEWWCLRWRSAAADGEGGVGGWTGDCPAPVDPCERIPPTGRWNPDWSTEFTTWTTQDAENLCIPDLPDQQPDPAQVADPPDANNDGLLDGPHAIGVRITDAEFLVCVASDHADRVQGAPHCSVDRLKFTVADARGEVPPTQAIALSRAVAADGLTVTEGDVTGVAFVVRLAVQPADDVTVTVTGPPEITVSPDALTFTDADWDRTRTITVTAADDTDRDDEDVTFTLTTASTDTDYDALTTSVAVTITDDDKPALRVTADALMVDETATATFDVQLASTPLFDVVIAVTSDDTSAATVAPASLTFTPSDRNVPQTVTVAAVDDADSNDETAQVTLSANSVDGDYHELTETVAVTVTDDDTPALLLSATSVTVDEGGTATMDVSLATEPSEPVMVGVASADPAVATASPATLTFTTDNWGTPRAITIAGAEDSDSRDTTTIVTLAADGDYQGVTSQVEVTVTDDDPPPTPPGNPENVSVTCSSEGAAISWSPPTTGGQPDSYSVAVTFYGGGEDHTQTVAHPTTEATFALGSGYYAFPSVRAANSAGENINWTNGSGESC